ncbi:hypothetical protein Rhopal_004945-T1 [Rhodotorula paludigena]|uniref:Uncharacterized protein n=1 Tax=Rhodotorula paludigena TaxID=86838 RepID=A0AAV5GQY1_9BASI|nr:hypothetical protein Rhopal_004945-T1 [Rhodotorula paludigena]
MPFAAPLASANAVFASRLAAAQFPPGSFTYIPSFAPPLSMSPGAHAPPPAPYPLSSHHPGSVQSASFFASPQFPLIYPVAIPHGPQLAPPAPQQQQQPLHPPPPPPAQQPQPQPAPPQPAAPAPAAAAPAQNNFFGAQCAAQGAAGWRCFVANIWELGGDDNVLDNLRPAYANLVNELLESSRLLPSNKPKPKVALIMIIDQIDGVLFHGIRSAGCNLVSAREVLWADLHTDTPLLFTISMGKQLIRTTASEMHAETGALLVELGVYRDLEGNIGKAMLESIEAMYLEGFPNSLETTKTAHYIVLEQLWGWLGRVYLSKGARIKAAGGDSGKDQCHTRSCASCSACASRGPPANSFPL